ncbi:hypothetical protein HMPREF9071_2010 [Capnocytophaga sp. oral taxon 338 str. F0234]|nr:hypothetical protein HMPREF9071_2010 [Capnocytophaga sp. oral taxon 338 str. F0234]
MEIILFIEFYFLANIRIKMINSKHLSIKKEATLFGQPLTIE